MARLGDVDSDPAHPVIACAWHVRGHFVVVWFNNPSSFLGGKGPRDILDSDPGLVVAQAQYLNDVGFSAG